MLIDIPNGGGQQKSRQLKDDLLLVRRDSGSSYYMDQRTGQRYLTKPKVLRYGNVELLKVGVDYYSRTKKVYANRQGIPEQLIVWMGFYLKIFDSHMPDNCWYLKDERFYREPQVCLLENDNECAYYLSGVLPDRSIIVMDGEERYYHVERGKEKHLLTTNANKDFEEVITRLQNQIEAGKGN